MTVKGKPIFRVGVNDADYNVYKTELIDGKKTVTWKCPFYVVWSNMIERCYSSAFHKKRPTYSNCRVMSEWHYFMTFRSWMETQDWQGKHLDKDLLIPGNKTYGPDTCIFLDVKINCFLLEGSKNASLPIGVSFDKEKRKFRAQAKNVVTGKNQNLGRFDEPEKAHQAWLSFKLLQAHILAEEQTDYRVAQALVARYENYLPS